MNIRILVVEDTPALRALLQLCLTRANYTVDLAEEGLTATEMFHAGDYAAVIMDIQMPIMDGLTAVARMRESEKIRARAAVPIIALTANTEGADMRKCLDAGFSAAVHKPFAREELLAIVARELGTAKPAPSSDERLVVTADPEIADLIPAFLETCRRETALMKTALERGDYQAIVVASHKLTGAGASFGFQPLSDESRGIEIAAKSGDAARLRAHLETLARYLERVSVVYP